MSALSSISERRVNDRVTLLDVKNAAGHATISQFGAQVLSFTPKHDGRERLYLSKLARIDGGKSIRGGVPVCWPWFGAHKQDATQPAHGYMRTRQWRLIEANAGADQTVLLLQAEDSSGPGFPGTARLQLRVSVGSTLELQLLTTNIGNAAFPLYCALHTYFAVDDIRQTQLEGLQGEYSDKTRDWAHFSTPVPYGFSEETDRIHLQPAPLVDIVQGSGARTQVASSGHDSIVVWNPWTECARNFPDMEAQDYTKMLCVETALTQGYTLEPGQTHKLVQRVG
jgi:glucose-6-phosphate 1-epimerase